MNEGLQSTTEVPAEPDGFEDGESWEWFKRQVEVAYRKFCRRRGMPLETLREQVNAGFVERRAARQKAAKAASRANPPDHPWSLEAEANNKLKAARIAAGKARKPITLRQTLAKEFHVR